MAYFDSEKNRAIWNKRLAQLEKEKELRKLNGYRPANQKQAAVQNAAADFLKPGVTIITFEQLVAKEEMRRRMRLQAERAARQRQAAAQMQHPAREVHTERTAEPARAAGIQAANH